MAYPSVEIIRPSTDPIPVLKGDGNRTRKGPIRMTTEAIDDRESGVGLRTFYSEGFEGSTFYSPRHRHNFEQIRYMISGEIVYGNQTFGPESCGYFPESVYYGPTKEEGAGTVYVVLQFPAPSGAPMITSREDSARASKELRDLGVVFEDGIATWPDGRKQDGYEIVFERLTGMKLEYAPARYDSPIFVEGKNFPWQSAGQPGVTYKHLGYFNEIGPCVSLVHLEPGAETEAGKLGCYQVRFVVDGEVEYADQPCPTGSALYYPPDKPYEATTSEKGGTVLVIQAKPRIGGEAPPMHVF
jgi:hypothetical protein